MDEIRDFLRSRSVANLTVVIINVAVFLILSCFGDTENADFMAAHGASYTPYIVQDGKYYLLITSMFLHFGLSHLFNNMVVLIFMGDILEKKLGKIRYLLIYFGGGIAGNCLSVYMDIKRAEFPVSAGASGAIFAVMGAILFRLRIVCAAQQGEGNMPILCRIAIFAIIEHSKAKAVIA